MKEEREKKGVSYKGRERWREEEERREIIEMKEVRIRESMLQGKGETGGKGERGERKARESRGE